MKREKLVGRVHRIGEIRLLKLRRTANAAAGERRGERRRGERATFIQIYGGFASTPDYECTFRRNPSVSAYACPVEIFSCRRPDE